MSNKYKKNANNKNKKEENKKNILSFPEKLNNGSILVLLVIYLAIAITLGIVSFPANKYISVPNYRHITWNDNISCYLKVTTTVQVGEGGKIEQTNRISAYLNKGLTDVNYKVHYEISGLTAGDTMEYMHTHNNRDDFVSLPMSHTLVSKTIAGNRYDTLFGEVKYYKGDTYNPNNVYVYKFKEPIIGLTKKEANNKEDNSEWYGDQLVLKATITTSSSGNNYDVYTSANIIASDQRYHLDYQVYMVTESGDIYPIVGFYNYFYTGSRLLINETTIDNRLKPKYIISKANFTDSTGKTISVFSREEIQK